jgi:hypothetical protein
MSRSKKMKINAKAQKQQVTYFTDLNVGDVYKVYGHVTYYMKICNVHGKHSSLELASGRYYPATTSRVVKVNAELTIEE